jgi:serine/threonine-protein kinase
MGLRPEKIGPYRIEGRLGAGGMGEVYRAWDERLERWVALKTVRAEAAGSAGARERFRREARSAAALSHAAIVQIYDILDWEEGDAIVMELVDGESLARRLARGRLGVREAVRLGREIAEGLAAAHAKGLIHRDLKPENVMVTPAGHAKILDFGLARRLDGEGRLTRDSVVVGTFRSMSPEQARGLPLDARSDLFSLGLLLYEMLAGASPFERPSTLETLTRICTLRQPPLRDFDPDVPELLSALVDHLLEKDPARRPRSALEVAESLEGMATPTPRPSFVNAATWIDLPGERGALPEPAPPPPVLPSGLPSGVAALPAARSEQLTSQAYRSLARWKPWALLGGLAALALLGAGVFTFLRRPAHPRGPLYVAVTRPEVVAGADGASTGDERAVLTAAGLRVALLRGLLALDGLSPLAPEQVDPVQGTPVAVARAVAADEVLTGRVACGANTCQASLSRIRGRDGILLWTQSFEIPSDRPYLMAEAVQSYLQQGYPEHALRPGLSGLEVRAEDYQDYLRVRGELDRKERGLSLDALLDRAAAIERKSPRFLEAYVLQAEILRQRFGAGRNPADLDRAFATLDEARRLAPADPRPLVARFEMALKGERLDAAEEALADLERLQPGDSEILVPRARLLERRGNKEQALALMREAARRRPSWYHLSRLADMEYRLGESDAARRHLQELLRGFPGYHSGWSLLAQIELLNGDPVRAAEIYRRLVERSPEVAEITNLGTAYLLLKRYPEAEARFRQALALEPKNPFVTLNLADVLLLMGDRGEADATYRRLLALVEKDPAAASWQVLSTRAQALAHLGDRRQAVEAVQQVLLLAQGNAQAAYEASLVYTLVDDRSSALVNADRALAQGVEQRWFTLPWFDPLRNSAELQDLLKRPRRPSSQTPSGRR